MKLGETSKGFALPTVLIASVAMMIVLLASLTALSSTSRSIAEQYYMQLAQEAAESGLARARHCLSQSNDVATWTAVSPLRPNSDCSGANEPGYQAEVVDSGAIRSTFTVTDAVREGGSYRVKATGFVELVGGTSGAVVKRFSTDLWASINYQAIIATKSASGAQQTCALVAGMTWCWGLYNEWGKLGDGTTAGSSTPVQVVRDEGVLFGKVDTDLAVGGNFACTVSDGEVYCWGRNDMGQLGRGAITTGANPRPAKVGGLLAGKTVNSITAGGRHVCALTTANELYCWGSNAFGQLGDGTTIDRASPVRTISTGTLGGKTITEVVSGFDASVTCAVADGRVYCWGRNANGEVGIGSTTANFTVPQAAVGGLLSGRTVTDIAVASTTEGGQGINGHVCVVADGSAYCWGANPQGVLGNNSNTSSNVPVAVNTSGALSGKTIASIGVGLRHACALTGEPRVYCWGRNSEGQLGIGNPAINESYVPLAVARNPGGLLSYSPTQIDIGSNRGCVIAGQLNFCWGLNAEGQIGDGTTENAFAPTRSRFLDNLRPAAYY